MEVPILCLSQRLLWAVEVGLSKRPLPLRAEVRKGHAHGLLASELELLASHGAQTEGEVGQEMLLVLSVLYL